MGLSSYPEFSLTKARELAKKHAELVSQGIDPKTELRRLASKARAEANQHVTFREFAETHFIPKKQTDYKGANQVRRLQQLLRDCVYPHIGSLRINEIDKKHIIRFLCKGPVTARSGKISTMLPNALKTMLKTYLTKQLLSM